VSVFENREFIKMNTKAHFEEWPSGDIAVQPLSEPYFAFRWIAEDCAPSQSDVLRSIAEFLEANSNIYLLMLKESGGEDYNSIEAIFYSTESADEVVIHRSPRASDE